MLNRNNLSLGNNLIWNAREVKIQGLQSDKLTVELKDGTLVIVTYTSCRPIELRSNVLKRCGAVKQTEIKYPLHKKEQWLINIESLDHTLEGFIFNKVREQIWSFDKIFTIRYFHQLQNAAKLVAPDFTLLLDK